MLRLICTVSILSVAGLSPVHSQTVKTPAQIAREHASSVVTIAAYGSRGEALHFGSGFFLPDGRIVTNSHVVAGASWLEVTDAEGNLLGNAPFAEALSVSADLAILPKVGVTLTGLVLSRDRPEVGAPVVVIGSPRGLTGTISDGIVSSVRRIGGQELIQISAPISQGSSGGPVMNEKGEVIGVAVSMLEGGQNLNFAVPVSAVTSLAASPPGRLPFPGGSERARTAGASSSGSWDWTAGLFGALAAATPLTFGRGVSGVLTEADVAGEEGEAYAFYRFRGTRGQEITLKASSPANLLDTELYVIPPSCIAGEDCSGLRYDDDSGGGLDAQLSFVLPEDGDYLVAVSGYRGQLGRYSLRLTRGYTPPTGVTPDSPWVHISQSTSARIFLNIDTVRQSGSSVMAWFRWEYTQLQRESWATYDAYEVLQEIRCDRRQFRSLQWIYLRAGNIERSSRAPDDWSYARPGSVGETMVLEACRQAGWR